ncbi:Major facilitator superfamily protein [Arabidopsis thaliana]|uniref:Major facilitator superfamily protein n=1 Tax=Arabidopsis thaliana TaxID=3702 RepID=A0A1P8AXA8_ARATH|nr:Major facilitator superfamily protein [Arabidopsis thaliana]ANM61275.1 Major facilitator superfamily protein [Arabidopsis thaliana]|eukprot:NP_001323502.1 Major facilitator superfamily protein [Arabidopsis thaliana]
MEEYRLGELRHLLTTVFLSGFSEFLVKPVMTDVTVAAVCSGLNETCSLAVYLTGVEQVTVGLGTMVMMPVIGNLSDRYGIKTLLTLPMCLSILPPAILAYRRDTNFFYAFYITKILFDMVCQGTVDCLAHAYVAKNVCGRKRISMFGVLAGVRSISGVCATFSARLLPIASIFQYFLKARFGFNKNDFAELILLVTIIGSISQLFILPKLVSAIGERRVLSTGLLMDSVNAACLSVSWSAWVPYATTVLVPVTMFVMPSVCGIASRQVGPGEQGKVQGCISGVKSFSGVVAPFIYSPLTALFLSEKAPFYFPGFSLLCVTFSLMIGFFLSLLIRDVPSPSMNKAINNISREEA